MSKAATIITFVFVAFLANAGDKLKTQFRPLNNDLVISNTIFAPTIIGDGLFDDTHKEKKKYKNKRSERPIGFNIMGFGPAGLAGVSLDGFLGPKIALEAGIGLRNKEGDINYFLGGRYHLFGGTRLNLTPYVGAYTTFHYNGRDVQNNSIYIPVGLNRIKKNGVSWSIELGYRKSLDTQKNLHGAFKLGYRF
jgi:hypothetical protein